MAKNELLPFADGEDANVLPTNQWEALTDILENGFQSGIARSEQVNRVLAQGAVASYVLGQLIVDQLNKNATLDKDTLYQNLVSALQENAKDACLPLNGGEMMGHILGDKNKIGQLILSSGVGWAEGDASLCLYNANGGGNRGAFQLVVGHHENFTALEGLPDGTLKWGGNEVEYNASGGDGYRRQATGLQFCWGTGTPNANGGGTINFAVPFSTSPVVLATPRTVLDSTCNSTVYIDRITESNFGFYKVRGNSGSQIADSGSFFWFAFGHWK